MKVIRSRNVSDPLRDALAFYADDANWRQNGPLDPNSANFTGGPARAALAAAPQPASVDREDVERLATELERQDEYAPLGHVGWEAATTLRALLNRAALQADEVAQ